MQLYIGLNKNLKWAVCDELKSHGPGDAYFLEETIHHSDATVLTEMQWRNCLSRLKDHKDDNLLLSYLIPAKEARKISVDSGNSDILKMFKS